MDLTALLGSRESTDISSILSKMTGGGMDLSKMMNSVMSPELMEALNNPELEALKNRPKIHASAGVDLNDPSWRRWWCIYPEYLNANFTVKQGRRLNCNLALVDVDIEEVLNALTSLNFPFVYECKRYPRNVSGRGGRVRVNFVGSQTELMIAVAVTISELREAAKELKRQQSSILLPVKNIVERKATGKKGKAKGKAKR